MLDRPQYVLDLCIVILFIGINGFRPRPQAIITLMRAIRRMMSFAGSSFRGMKHSSCCS
jgi:hypothetical protein